MIIILIGLYAVYMGAFVLPQLAAVYRDLGIAIPPLATRPGTVVLALAGMVYAGYGCLLLGWATRTRAPRWGLFIAYGLLAGVLCSYCVGAFFRQLTP